LKSSILYHMKAIKVTFTNGDTITTSINGTREEICNYYFSNTFYLGEQETPAQGVSVEYLD